MGLFSFAYFADGQGCEPWLGERWYVFMSLIDALDKLVYMVVAYTTLCDLLLPSDFLRQADAVRHYSCNAAQCRVAAARRH
jgi:hypothetical protein